MLQNSKWNRRLSRTENQAATVAFNRARGHHCGLTFKRFQETLMQEAFPAMPELLVQRLFRCWNTSSSGELLLSEFITGVAIAAKGSREDFLEMVFRMISTSSDSKTISRSDTKIFLECVTAKAGYVAIERSATTTAPRLWTVEELEQELFSSTLTRDITCKSFCAILGSESLFHMLHFVDWIQKLGMELLKSQHLAPDGHAIPLSFIKNRGPLSSKQREGVRHELRAILFELSTSRSLILDHVIERFYPVLHDKTRIDAATCEWFSTFTIETHGSSSSKPVAGESCEYLKLFVLRLCCAHASSTHQVYRLLFELFDEHSNGKINVEQLGYFFQFATGLSFVDSEREASIAIKRRGSAAFTSQSPPPSPGGTAFLSNMSSSVLNLTQFIEVAQQQPGFSLSEVETALLLCHLPQFMRSLPPSTLPEAIKLRECPSLLQMIDCYPSQNKTQASAFCLLDPSEWQQIIDDITRSENHLEKKSTCSRAVRTSTQSLSEEAYELLSGHVMLPLSLWLVVSYWHQVVSEMPLLQLHIEDTKRDWATRIKLRQQGAKSLHAFWSRISVTLTSRDGFERQATFPQVLIFERCSMQSVIDAVVAQKGWKCVGGEEDFPSVTLLCQCQVLLASRNAAGEIKATAQQDPPTDLSQEQLSIPLNSILPAICPTWAVADEVEHDNRSFELHIYVVEVEIQEEKTHQQTKGAVVDIGNPVTMIQRTEKRDKPSTVVKMPRGLVNLGNTCFMNSALQCLAVTPAMTEYFSRGVHHQDLRSESTSLGTRIKSTPVGVNLSGNSSLPLALGDFFASLNRSPAEYVIGDSTVSPVHLLKIFSGHFSHLSDGNQQDAQEFLVCLFGQLSENLKRHPSLTQPEEPSILSPRSHSLLASVSRPIYNVHRAKDTHVNEEDNIFPRLCIGDSNGRHDRLVATEWWVSHILNEPSVITALFSGQFKSALTCDHCAHQSVRFEPFSSLQLPLAECTGGIPEAEDQHDVIAIVHFVESSRTPHSAAPRGPVRTMIQVNEHTTLSDVLARIPSPRMNSNPLRSNRRYVIGSLSEFTIQDLLVTDSDEDTFEANTPANALPNPLHAFEVYNIEGNGDDSAAPTTGSSKVHLRFLHRKTFLAPFYCSTPTRYGPCGTPFVCCSTRGALTGPALYRMVLQRFLLGHKHQSCSYSPSFVLRRVGDDGMTCSCCHWSTGCRGCTIQPTATAAELLDLENCNHIAIDWDLQMHPHEASEFWWLQSYPTIDDDSYVHYLRYKTHPLMQSFHSLCSTEHLDATCPHCQKHSSTPTPHTKQLSLWSLPPILILQLKRFELSTNSNGSSYWKKLSHSVAFPVQGLDLAELVSPINGAHDDSESCGPRCTIDALDARVRRGMHFLQQELHIPLGSASRTCTLYDLYAVINHAGSGIGSGHYTAHIRRPSESCWWLADDAHVTPLQEDELSPSSTAYLLFYVRQDVASGATDLDDLFPAMATTQPSTSCTLQ